MSKLSARPDSGDRWCVMSLDFHSPATQRPLSSQQPQQPGYGTGSGQSGGGAGAEGQGSGVWGASGTGVWGTGGGGAAAAGPALESLFVVTESQTLSFNIQTGLKVRTWWWVGEKSTLMVWGVMGEGGERCCSKALQNSVVEQNGIRGWGCGLARGVTMRSAG